ncbi:MAG: DUF1178 family protein [Desulfobacteraceae bacterium]|nr:DUF1178 family protein [Desulfobacteraceae bacterium]
MIVFDLQCNNGHAFEGWFDDGQSYEDQKEKSLIACPVCNDTSVIRVPSTFAIKSSSRVPEKIPADETKIAEVGKKIADFADKNFDDVGCDFAKEALKIHYGVSEPRNIKGVSTDQEEKILKEEGIQFLKLPIPPQSDT